VSPHVLSVDSRSGTPVAPTADPSHRIVRVEHIMGTAIRVELVGEPAQGDVADEVFGWFREVDTRFSLFKADSEMSRIARGELSEVEAHPDIHEVLGLCEAVRVRSGGAFDARRHRDDGLLDPTGLVKGWSVDRAGDILRSAGATDWSINAGGDILVHGLPRPGELWRIGIQHPQRRDAIAAVIQATDAAVATSGAYERGQHIVDPRGSRPRDALQSVTVVGPTLALADAYATAAYAMGDGAAAWIAGLAGYEGGVITTSDRILWTEGMVAYLSSPSPPPADT
jgi:thiamine biosynthesis lipoprotein